MKHSPYFDLESRKFTAQGVRYISDTFKGFDKKGINECDTAEYLRKVLSVFSDSASIEDVAYCPMADKAAYTIPAVIMIFCSFVFFLTRFIGSLAFPFTALIFCFAALCLFVYGFIFGKSAADFLLTRVKGRNVVAVRKPYARTNKRVIICANIDRAYEYRYSTGFSPYLLFGFTIVYAFAMFVSLLIFLFYITSLPEANDIWEKIAVIQLVFNIVYIPAVFFFSNKKRIRGAAHNLSAVYAAIGIMKELSDSGYRYSDTEIICLLTAAKNAGQKGAASYIKKHMSELRKADTTVIVLESLCKTDEISIVTKDETGLLKTSSEINALMKLAAGNVGVKTVKSPIKLGSTDAAKFIHKRIPSAIIRAAGKDRKHLYPNRFDDTKAVNSECIESVMKTVIEGINLLTE
ncbi:MAG: M28 family peptidase [Clostridiales bacterium]|jgi:hypothetical protein|nr:M28 family peptidase [Clostridiales bacterium]